ncbi:MAG: C40 family peptidase [Cyclobacteriaceae bacterium]|nr:C40 family peptidase [Cyclobacteriaceae bacterium]MDW8331317.1 NlpC/P60 family protein [Cyclobacteriaceae bacterium]
MKPVEGYGVCRLSMVAVWQEPSFTSGWNTQLLFGDHYQVIAETTDKKFLRIKIYADGAEGWIDSRQHHAISAEYFDYLSRAEFKITTDVTSGILYNRSTVVIVMGSIIPISSAELFRMEEQFAFNGEAKSLGQYRDAEYLKSQAMKYLSTPFLPGGKSPFGIDDAAFVQMAFRFCGYMLPRFALQQIRCGRSVNDITASRTGDVLFFRSANNLHPAILISTDPFQVIHVVDKVRIDDLTPDAEVADIRRILTSE